MATKHAEVASRTSALITSGFSSTESTRLSDFHVLPKTKFSAMWNAESLQQATPVELLNSTSARTVSFSFLRGMFDFDKNHSQGPNDDLRVWRCSTPEGFGKKVEHVPHIFCDAINFPLLQVSVAASAHVFFASQACPLCFSLRTNGNTATHKSQIK